MARFLFSMALLAIALVAFAAEPAMSPAPAAPPIDAPANPLGKVADRPLYIDPVFNHPTDPVVAYNTQTKKWFMYYTQRRGDSIALIHGTKIGIAASADHGASWQYLGIADITYGQDQHPNDCTYWAPEVFSVGDIYHMFLAYVPGIFNDWNHPREIVHLTSKDGIKWDTVGKVDLKSDKVIDPAVEQLSNGTWRMFYKDEAKPNSLWYADSPDLAAWTVKGPAVTDRYGEGPNCIHWQGKYWLMADTDKPVGQAIWSSDDCTNWKPQASTLYGSHGDAVTNGDRAWWIYFGGQPVGTIDWAVLLTKPGEVMGMPMHAPATTSPTTSTAIGRGSSRNGLSINVVELKILNGELKFTNPSEPVRINLADEPKPKK